MAQLHLVLVFLCVLHYGGCQSIIRPNITVAKDGSGNYNTIMAAVFAAPNKSVAKYYIKIKEGIYEEYVEIERWKTNIVFIGEGKDKTIISGNKSYGGGIGTYESATVGINGAGFMAQDITFRNTAGPADYQAVALRVSANFSTFYRCQFEGYQDTVYTQAGDQFYRECIVLGTIDFICGDAKVVFQNSVIEVRKPMKGQYIVITAQKRNDKNSETGLVLQNCTLRLATPVNVRMYLGRPWGNFSRTVIMQSSIDVLINPRGWIKFGGKRRVWPYYLEYRNKGMGADIKRRVKWASATNDPRIVSKFTVRNFIKGDKWIPSTVPHYLDLL